MERQDGPDAPDFKIKWAKNDPMQLRLVLFAFHHISVMVLLLCDVATKH